MSVDPEPTSVRVGLTDVRSISGEQVLRRLVGAAALVLGLGSPLAVTPNPAAADDGMGFTCSKGQLCLHLQDPATGAYRWTRWTACGVWHKQVDGRPLDHYNVTWIINNQTHGAQAEFEYWVGGPRIFDFWTTPKPVFKGPGKWAAHADQFAVSFKTC